MTFSRGVEASRGGGAVAGACAVRLREPLRDSDESLDELSLLLGAIAAKVVVRRVFSVRRPSPRTLIGSGALEDLRQRVAEHSLGVICFDSPLNAVQHRNLERSLGCRVLDRTALILAIFAANARSEEGRLQVARAQCVWQKSRLAKAWGHLERQRGGGGFLAGPGERQIELDRRELERSMKRLDIKLDKLSRRRAIQRRHRRHCRLVALTGYTNSGKSSLFNALKRFAGSGGSIEQVARQQPFQTLDTKITRLGGGGRPLLLADTVGFISDLPTFLIEAFAATLEEVVQADIVLHVRDISASDSLQQRNEVLQILERLGCRSRIVEVWNKIDKVATGSAYAMSGEDSSPSLLVSAKYGWGIEALFDHIRGCLAEEGLESSSTNPSVGVEG